MIPPGPLRTLLLLLTTHVLPDIVIGIANNWHVDPIMVKIPHNRRDLFPTSSVSVDLAGMRGECERFQLWGWDELDELKNVTVKLTAAKSNSGASISPENWIYKQQGYVNTSTPTRYRCKADILIPGPPRPTPKPHIDRNCSDTPWNECWTGCPAVHKNWTDRNSCAGGKVWPPPYHKGGASCNLCECNVKHTKCSGDNRGRGHLCRPGWYPDPLLEVTSSGIPLIPRGWTQPIYVELCIPRDQAPGNYTGQLDLHAAGSKILFTAPVKVEVWDIELPHLNDTNAFNTAFNFNSNMSAWYPPGTQPETWWGDWLPFLAHHRVPGDSIYLSQVCMCLCIRLCMRMYMCMCIRTCVFPCAYECACVCACVWCMSMCMYMWTHACVFMCVCVLYVYGVCTCACVCMYVCSCMYVHACVCVCVYKCTCVCAYGVCSHDR